MIFPMSTFTLRSYLRTDKLGEYYLEEEENMYRQHDRPRAKPAMVQEEDINHDIGLVSFMDYSDLTITFLLS